jgi:hypothetical protein
MTKKKLQIGWDMDEKPVFKSFKKSKLEFSKGHLIYANFLVFFVFLVTAYIAIKNNEPISNVSIAIITAYGGFATCGYFVQNIERTKSLNELKAKHVEHKVSPEEAHYE